LLSFDAIALHRPTAVLTERGHVVRAVCTLLAALRELPDNDRRDIRELLEVELEHAGLDRRMATTEDGPAGLSCRPVLLCCESGGFDASCSR